MCIYVEFHDSQYDELSLKTNPGCLDRLLTSNTCIGNLRLCLKNHGFLFAFDQELWLQSNPEAFSTFIQSAAVAKNLMLQKLKARRIQDANCYGTQK